MPTSFPTGLDSLTNPISSDYLSSPDHAGQHTNENDTVEAIEAKVGVDNSTVASSLDLLVKSIHFNVKEYGAVGDGLIDDTTAVQAALTAGAGATVFFPKGNYKVTTGLTVSANTTIFGYGAKLLNTTDNIVFLSITSGCKVFGIEVQNTGRVAEDTVNSKAITAVGAYDAYISDIVVRDCYFHDLEGYGVYLKWARNVDILNNKIFEVGYSGVQTLSCAYVKVKNNHVKGVGAGDSVNCYNISFTRGNTDNDTLSEHCIADSNLCEDNLLWKGLDAHGGHSIIFTHNVVKNCLKGIELKYTQYPGETSYGAGTDCIISENIVYGIADGTTVFGIGIAGLADFYAVNNIIEGNILYNCGITNETWSGAINVYAASNTIIKNNQIFQPYTSGIALRQCIRCNVSGNVIQDTQSGTTTTYGIWMYAGVTGVVDNNTIVLVNAALNTHVGEIGIFVRSDSGNDVRVGLANYVTYTTPYSVNPTYSHWGEFTNLASRIYSGTATPEGSRAASIGSIFINTSGGSATTLYIKESGTSNTGWVGK